MKAETGTGEGFSSLYEEYERLSRYNVIDISRRNLIRAHVGHYLKPNDRILELNSGSGIDALHFAQNGWNVLATDISEGSEIFLRNKISETRLENLRFQKSAFEDLSAIDGTFDHIFSNFGGLNCTNNLKTVFSQFSRLVNPDGYVSLVIMPKFYPWEMATLLKGNKNAFRRLQKNGIAAQIGNDTVHTYYHSPAEVKAAFPKGFAHVKTVNIGTFYPSAHFALAGKYPNLMRFLVKLDGIFNNTLIMPKGIGDYFIITFKKTA